MSKHLLFSAMFLSTLIVGNPVFAVDLQKQINDQIGAGARAAELQPPQDPRLVVARVITIFLEIIGTLFLVLVILGGYWYITAKGDDEKVDKAKDTIKAAIFGLIIVMIGYAITVFVASRFSAAVIQGGQTNANYEEPIGGR